MAVCPVGSIRLDRGLCTGGMGCPDAEVAQWIHRVAQCRPQSAKGIWRGGGEGRSQGLPQYGHSPLFRAPDVQRYRQDWHREL